MNLRAAIEAFAFGLMGMVLATSCSDTPRGVLPREEMALLMADIHTAEGVVDMNRREYESDSARMVLRQSVLQRHGIDQATMDSSLAWYGRNLDKYMDMYDRTIAILEQRVTETGNRIAAEGALSVAGDSVDVWYGPRLFFFRGGDAAPSVTFLLRPDENWEQGDNYVWRTKVSGNGQGSEWTMAARYSDGSIDVLRENLGGDGWRELSLISDSTRTATEVFGYMTAHKGVTTMYADSVQLIRHRRGHGRYGNRWRQQHIPAP